MSKSGDMAKQQILEEYDRAIARLESPPATKAAPDTCRRHNDVAEGVLLMMRFHRLQLRESLTESSLRRQFLDGLRIAVIAAAVSLALAPDVWGAVGRLLGALTR